MTKAVGGRWKGGGAAEKKAPKLSAKKMAAMGFVPKEDPKAKKKKTAAKKK